MLKYAFIAGACLMAAAHADADTAPVMLGHADCGLPQVTAENNVRMRVHITAEGTVDGVKVLESSGKPELDETIVKCVSSYKFQPATHNGTAVAYETTRVFHTMREETWNKLAGFSAVEYDLNKRCHKLYPVKAVDLPPGRTSSMVTVSRDQAGEVRVEVTGTAGAIANKQAVACVKDILKDSAHADLPASFTRTFEVRWSPRN